MGAGGHNRGAHQRKGNIVSGGAPVLPRLVSRSLADAEDSLIPGAPDASAHDGNGYNSCAFEEGSALHEPPPQTFSPSSPQHDTFEVNVKFRSARSASETLHS